MATENGSARIGKSVVIRGEVKGGEDLIIDGRVEGTVTLTESRLTIGPSANIAADLSARDILIQGTVQGNIVASGRVELRAGSVVEADKVRSVVTPDDYASESEAELAAQKLISKL